MSTEKKRQLVQAVCSREWARTFLLPYDMGCYLLGSLGSGAVLSLPNEEVALDGFTWHTHLMQGGRGLPLECYLLLPRSVCGLFSPNKVKSTLQVAYGEKRKVKGRWGKRWQEGGGGGGEGEVREEGEDETKYKMTPSLPPTSPPQT